jgi:AcrR family transcriptional regulator
MMGLMPPKVNIPGVKVGESKESRDGRSARWDAHREERRGELVEAAVIAIETHGRGAGITEIAAIAGVSKPVLYRYFTDKRDLMTAVGNWAAEQIINAIWLALDTDEPIRTRVQDACNAYLELIKNHQELFFLVLENRTGEADVATAVDTIATGMTLMLNDDLYALGQDSSAAEPWAHALIGIGTSMGSWWLQRGTMSREVMGQHMSTFIWHAFEGAARELGVEIDTLGRFSLLGSIAQDTKTNPPIKLRTIND